VFKSRNVVACALSVVILVWASSQSHAADEFFEQSPIRSAPKRKAAAATAKSSEAQKKAPASSSKGSAGKIRLVAAGRLSDWPRNSPIPAGATAYTDDSDPQSSVLEASPTIDLVSSPAASSAGPATAVPVYPVASSPSEVVGNSTHCLNCGQDDHYQKCIRNSRKNFKQTWYPRAAPYCQPGWGWTQPCWRRAVDTYNCPRPQQLAQPQPPVSNPEMPEEQPSINAPADGTSIIRNTAGQRTGQ